MITCQYNLQACPKFYFGGPSHALKAAARPPHSKIVRLKGGGVAGAGGDQVFDFGEGGDVAAGADSGAVEGGGGAGEFELAGERPAL
jgi:hypothetical protein